MKMVKILVSYDVRKYKAKSTQTDVYYGNRETNCGIDRKLVLRQNCREMHSYPVENSARLLREIMIHDKPCLPLLLTDILVFQESIPLRIYPLNTLYYQT